MVPEESYSFNREVLVLRLDEEWLSVGFCLILVAKKEKMMVKTVEMTKKMQSSIGIKEIKGLRSQFFNTDTASSITEWDFHRSILPNGNERI